MLKALLVVVSLILISCGPEAPETESTGSTELAVTGGPVEGDGPMGSMACLASCTNYASRAGACCSCSAINSTYVWNDFVTGPTDEVACPTDAVYSCGEFVSEDIRGGTPCVCYGHLNSFVFSQLSTNFLVCPDRSIPRACTKFSTVNVEGGACICNHRMGAWQKSTFNAALYLCR